MEWLGIGIPYSDDAMANSELIVASKIIPR